MDVLDKADITCDQTLVETDKVIKVSDFLGKPNIKKSFEQQKLTRKSLSKIQSKLSLNSMVSN